MKKGDESSFACDIMVFKFNQKLKGNQLCVVGVAPLFPFCFYIINHGLLG